MMNEAEVIKRNNIKRLGKGEHTLVLAHGFGCSQSMWHYLIPYLSDHYQIILFDYVGSGASDFSFFSKDRYSDLEGYADDIVELCEALSLKDVSLIGHSVSGTIGLLAAQKIPDRISSMIMVCPSPCFLNVPPHYFGGFEVSDLEELVNLMDKNYIGWANHLAPLVMGLDADPVLLDELSHSFCSTDPVMAKVFAKATFFSDYRHRLPDNQHPTLLLQSQNDSLASVSIGEYMRSVMPLSELRVIEAKGHCLHMTHPEAVFKAINSFLVKRVSG